jgi:type I restriction enzyme S subunit
VLFNSKNSGDLIGKTALADESVDGSLINENIMRLRFSPRLLPEFVAVWFLGPVMRSRITLASSASTNVAAVYQKDLVGLPIWAPPLEVQAMLAHEFEVVRGSGERLTVSSHMAERRAAAVRRSLLAAAFGGRLTANSPIEEFA